jgi:hypothetical protein
MAVPPPACRKWAPYGRSFTGPRVPVASRVGVSGLDDGRFLHVHTDVGDRAVPAGADRSRAVDAARVPGRLARVHARRVHPRSSPVHRLVLAARPSRVRRPPRRHRVLRPPPRGCRKARATVARRLCTIVGFYRYAEEEGVIEHSPAVHIRRPRIDYESHVGEDERTQRCDRRSDLSSSGMVLRRANL